MHILPPRWLRDDPRAVHTSTWAAVGLPFSRRSNTDADDLLGGAGAGTVDDRVVAMLGGSPMTLPLRGRSSGRSPPPRSASPWGSPARASGAGPGEGVGGGVRRSMSPPYAPSYVLASVPSPGRGGDSVRREAWGGREGVAAPMGGSDGMSPVGGSKVLVMHGSKGWRAANAMGWSSVAGAAAAVRREEHRVPIWSLAPTPLRLPRADIELPPPPSSRHIDHHHRVDGHPPRQSVGRSLNLDGVGSGDHPGDTGGIGRTAASRTPTAASRPTGQLRQYSPLASSPLTMMMRGGAGADPTMEWPGTWPSAIPAVVSELGRMVSELEAMPEMASELGRISRSLVDLRGLIGQLSGRVDGMTVVAPPPPQQQQQPTVQHPAHGGAPAPSLPRADVASAAPAVISDVFGGRGADVMGDRLELTFGAPPVSGGGTAGAAPLPIGRVVQERVSSQGGSRGFLPEATDRDSADSVGSRWESDLLVGHLPGCGDYISDPSYCPPDPPIPPLSQRVRRARPVPGDPCPRDHLRPPGGLVQVRGAREALLRMVDGRSRSTAPLAIHPKRGILSHLESQTDHQSPNQLEKTLQTPTYNPLLATDHLHPKPSPLQERLQPELQPLPQPGNKRHEQPGVVRISLRDLRAGAVCG